VPVSRSLECCLRLGATGAGGPWLEPVSACWEGAWATAALRVCFRIWILAAVAFWRFASSEKCVIRAARRPARRSAQRGLLLRARSGQPRGNRLWVACGSRTPPRVHFRVHVRARRNFLACPSVRAPDPQSTTMKTTDLLKIYKEILIQSLWKRDSRTRNTFADALASGFTRTLWHGKPLARAKVRDAWN
jgi:hypothetical protein